MKIPHEIASSLCQPVAIFGCGASGRAAAALLESAGASVLFYDRHSERCRCGTFNRTEALRHSLVIISPGFQPEHSWIKEARWAGCTVMSEFDLATRFWQGRMIAITGTNGKSTVTTLLADALRRAGLQAHAAGNIGIPLSQLCIDANTADTIAVCEVSSFQAEQSTALTPETVLWTNFDEDHLDRHPTLADYFKAKLSLVEKLGNGSFFVGESVHHWADKLGITLPGNTICVSEIHLPDDAIPATFRMSGQRSNLALVRAYWKAADLPAEALEQATEAYQPLPHRLSLILDTGLASYWNDSKATNFNAALAAVKSFEEPVYWIGGGKDKGGDIECFCKALAPHLRAAYVIGETSQEIARALGHNGIPVRECPTLEAAVRKAATAAEALGGRVVFSPGFSSHDMFDSYIDRGEQFNRFVLQLKDSPNLDKNLEKSA